MDVQLYVYDLSRGMARSMSQSFLGIQIDAVYHTALVFDNREYFFGQGVQMCYPGTTHHGRPMEIIPLGKTHLPMDTVLEYLESLKEVYTPESYDLFAHNCNNFTHDFAMFLLGTGIPAHITNLPRRVLDTPFGAMLKSQIDQSMRSITQASLPPQSIPNGHSAAPNGHTSAPNSEVAAKQESGSMNGTKFGRVFDVTESRVLNELLQSASNTAAALFFTSSTCAPCRIAYPMFDQLAEHYPQAVFIKIDISKAQAIAMQYQIRATPTFITFSRSSKNDTWSGADPNLLKANIDHLMQLTFPPHPHALLKVPTLQFASLKPVTYIKTPPLDKLMTKLGPAATQKELLALRSFVETRNRDPREASLPDLPSVSRTFQTSILTLPAEVRFAAFDLFRCAMIDPRVTSFFAEESSDSTVHTLVQHVNGLDSCPHSLRLVTLHLACNLFISPLYVKELMRQESALSASLVQLISSSLLDASHPTTRVAAASLAFNIAGANYRIRREQTREGMRESQQVELAASLLETVLAEENADAAKAALLALGHLFYYAPQDGEVTDLAGALDARTTLKGSKLHAQLAGEVASLV